MGQTLVAGVLLSISSLFVLVLALALCVKRQKSASALPTVAPKTPKEQGNEVAKINTDGNSRNASRKESSKRLLENQTKRENVAVPMSEERSDGGPYNNARQPTSFRVWCLFVFFPSHFILVYFHVKAATPARVFSFNPLIWCLLPAFRCRSSIPMTFRRVVRGL